MPPLPANCIVLQSDSFLPFSTNKRKDTLLTLSCGNFLYRAEIRKIGMPDKRGQERRARCTIQLPCTSSSWVCYWPCRRGHWGQGFIPHHGKGSVTLPVPSAAMPSSISLLCFSIWCSSKKRSCGALGVKQNSFPILLHSQRPLIIFV